MLSEREIKSVFLNNNLSVGSSRDSMGIKTLSTCFARHIEHVALTKVTYSLLTNWRVVKVVIPKIKFISGMLKIQIFKLNSPKSYNVKCYC